MRLTISSSTDRRSASSLHMHTATTLLNLMWVDPGSFQDLVTRVPGSHAVAMPATTTAATNARHPRMCASMAASLRLELERRPELAEPLELGDGAPRAGAPTRTARTARTARVPRSAWSRPSSDDDAAPREHRDRPPGELAPLVGRVADLVVEHRGGDADAPVGVPEGEVRVRAHRDRPLARDRARRASRDWSRRGRRTRCSESRPVRDALREEQGEPELDPRHAVGHVLEGRAARPSGACPTASKR